MVKRNHRKLYRENPDPWAVGDATAARYDRYLKLVGKGETVLDMACGTGAFTARLPFKRRYGFDISRDAIQRAIEKYPECHFTVDSLTNPYFKGKFDAIVCADALYYLPRRKQSKVIRWISRHLEPDGCALIACYAPGGLYPTPESLNKLVSNHMDILHQEMLDTDHCIILARERRTFGAFTIDYENWMPTPGDFYKEVYSPAFMFSDLDIPVTYFVDMAGIEPRWIDNLKDLALRGHDLQLHYHFGFPQPYLKAEEYPGSVTFALADAAQRLEAISGRPVVCFRAGAYQVQPFNRLNWALRLNNIPADSSVWKGGVSAERGYDFREAPVVPYYADPSDAAKRSSGVGIIEIPILTRNGRQFTDNRMWQPSPGYNVLIAHTKGDHDWERLWRWLKKFKVEWITMTEMVGRVRGDLQGELRRKKRALELMAFTYANISVGHTDSNDWREILKGGRGLCTAYAVVLGELLRRAGYKVRWVTMKARDHVDGRGRSKTDDHDVVEVFLDKWYTFDPTTNTYFDKSVKELIRDAKQSDICRSAKDKYSTDYWYSRVTRIAYRYRVQGFSFRRLFRALWIYGISTIKQGFL